MKILAKNRRAGYDYAIEHKMTAGLVLSGAEVKSGKLGQVSLKGSFVSLKDGEAYLSNAHFTPYNRAGNSSRLDPDRPRKLLLHKRELEQLTGYKQAGAAIVPLSLAEDRNLIKLEIGIGRGRKKYDKRQLIKKRDQIRDTAKELPR
ncbi:MAG TPA: SsrA-binding protein SmpB [Candidatus Dormibacteraeota bacterium]|nr:SsrA-binding protein SmpB [Candidatus Dormibacteraeota bacterium]